MKQNTAMSYEQFMEQASEQLTERFQIDYLKYADGETTTEQHFYGNCKYWESELKTSIPVGANLYNDNVRDVQKMSAKMKQKTELQYTMVTELPMAGAGKTYTKKEWKRIYGYEVGLVAGVRWESNNITLKNGDKVIHTPSKKTLTIVNTVGFLSNGVKYIPCAGPDNFIDDYSVNDIEPIKK